MENPKIRAVEAFPVEQQGQTLICLRDPSGLAPEPIMLGMGAYFIVTLFDGKMSLKDIQAAFAKRFGEMIPLEKLDTLDVSTNESRLGDQYTRMHGTPYVMRRRMITSPSRAPCTPPPWGALVAINLETGARAWDVPLGDPSAVAPGLAGVSKTPLGTPNLGGPIATAGGVVFIGATMDPVLRAFDIETGKELWRGKLPGGARATPMTYQVTSGGKQFVVVCVGGGEEWGRGDFVVAFALK